MITEIQNLVRMWGGKGISNKHPGFLFCVSGLILQCHFSGLVMCASGFFMLTMCLGRLKGYGLALSWGLLPTAIASAVTMDHPHRDVVLTICYMLNLIVVNASQLRSDAQKSCTQTFEALDMAEAALRAQRRLSMAEPVRFKVGPVIGRNGGVPIPVFIEDVSGQRYFFLRVEPGPIACIQDGEFIIAPGIVYAAET